MNLIICGNTTHAQAQSFDAFSKTAILHLLDTLFVVSKEKDQNAPTVEDNAGNH